MNYLYTKMINLWKKGENEKVYIRSVEKNGEQMVLFGESRYLHK